jgi:hypothetical protein
MSPTIRTAQNNAKRMTAITGLRFAMANTGRAPGKQKIKKSATLAASQKHPN